MRSRSISVAILALSLAWAAPLGAADLSKEHVSAGLGLAFEVPDACAARDENHRPDDSTRQISHSVIVTCGGPDLLRVDMWDAPGAKDIATWVAEHLAPLLEGAARVASEMQPRLDLPAVVIERRRTPQTFARRLVAMKIHGRVYLYTLEHSDEEASTDLLRRCMATLRVLAEDGR